MRSRTAIFCLLLMVVAAACKAPPASRTAVPDSSRDSLAVYRRLPSDSAIPDDELGHSIRRGLALLRHTGDSLPAHVGNRLACISCHPDDGRKPGAIPWVGVYGQFPQYRSRGASVITLEERVNGCFRRSMNGQPLDVGGRDMRDIVAYMAWLSRGIPVGASIPGQGLAKLSVTSGDSAAGRAIFDSVCSRCHGPSGEGTTIAPPLWGPHSFNIGAGMARVRTAAAFIHHNMPFDRPGSLTEQQAFDVARYVTLQPRPDLPGKELDWPNGDPPPDVAYPTNAVSKGGQAGRRSGGQ